MKPTTLPYHLGTRSPGLYTVVKRPLLTGMERKAFSTACLKVKSFEKIVTQY